MSEQHATGPGWELRLGDWRTALAHVGEVDSCIFDAPYSERTHGGQKHGRKDPKYSPDTCLTHRGLDYASLSPDDVTAFVDAWAPRTRGWFVSITDSVLAPCWQDNFESHGLTTFAPLACVQSGMNVRLAGDGPSNWTCWAVVARPKALHKWGTLPGAYVGTQDQDRKRMGASVVHGGKPLWLMRQLVRDYTRPGDLVCDAFAGGGTTLLAAVSEGRRAVGSELDPVHFDIARKRLERGYTAPLFDTSPTTTSEQVPMFTEEE